MSSKNLLLSLALVILSLSSVESRCRRNPRTFVCEKIGVGGCRHCTMSSRGCMCASHLPRDYFAPGPMGPGGARKPVAKKPPAQPSFEATMEQSMEMMIKMRRLMRLMNGGHEAAAKM